MVILVTGCTHTGKTLFAQRLLEKYKYPYLPIDHLKMGLFRSGLDRLSLFCPVQAVYGGRHPNSQTRKPEKPRNYNIEKPDFLKL